MGTYPFTYLPGYLSTLSRVRVGPGFIYLGCSFGYCLLGQLPGTTEGGDIREKDPGLEAEEGVVDERLNEIK